MKAARVTLDYDGVYGTTTGPWTTDAFIEAAFKELSAAAARDRLVAHGCGTRRTAHRRGGRRHAGPSAASGRRASRARGSVRRHLGARRHAFTVCAAVERSLPPGDHD